MGYCEVIEDPISPTVFNPRCYLSSEVAPDPPTLFPLCKSQKARVPVDRFINRTNPTEFLIYTDGSCLENGRQVPKAGCAFVYSDTDQHPLHGPSNGFVRFRLEEEGPTGVKHRQTNNRAELRAVIAALQFREWDREVLSVVIATDSTHVVEGITSWIHEWLARGWTRKDGKPVKNRDLWECLLDEVEHCGRKGLHVKFWRIPREWNSEADHHAKLAAATWSAREKFTQIVDDAS